MANPKISIITITYNSEKTVRETFESVRRQHYDNLEYLIVDGGSTDSTLQITEEYKDIITSCVSEKDNGISDAMNKGIKRATGDVIGIIHSDDMLAERALNRIAEAYDTKTDVYYGDLIVCAEEGKITHMLKAKSDLSRMPYYVEMSHPSTFIRKSSYEKYGLYDEKYRCVMDNDLLIRFYKKGAIFQYISKPLAVYRVGGTNMKLRKVTIKESREIAIKYGGSRVIADYLYVKKTVSDKAKSLFGFLHSKRVIDINDEGK